MFSPRRTTESETIHDFITKNRHNTAAIEKALLTASTSNKVDDIRALAIVNGISSNIITQASKLVTSMLAISALADVMNAQYFKQKEFERLSSSTTNLNTDPKPPTLSNDDDILPPVNSNNGNDAIPTTPSRVNIIKGTVTPEETGTITPPPTPPTPLSAMKKRLIFGGVALAAAQVEGDTTNSSTATTPDSLPTRRTLNFSPSPTST